MKGGRTRVQPEEEKLRKCDFECQDAVDFHRKTGAIAEIRGLQRRYKDIHAQISGRNPGYQV